MFGLIKVISAIAEVVVKTTVVLPVAVVADLFEMGEENEKHVDKTYESINKSIRKMNEE